jgi:hypothetical protein
MVAITQPVRQGPDNAFTGDGLVRGMGKSAEEIDERYRSSTQEYWGSSEALPPYPSNFFPITEPNMFERYARRNLRDIYNTLCSLRQWGDGWDGHDAVKIKEAAIVSAFLWVVDLFQAVGGRGWIKPNVTGNPAGDVVFEWWYGERKLTVYVEESGIEYVQVWGATVDAKITVGDIESKKDSLELWLWLIGLK